MLKKLRNRGGQSALEFAMLIVILIGALLGMQNYFKRGIQGRMKASVDGMGEQYDPMFTEVDITHAVTGTTVTNILLQNAVGGGGVETTRGDTAVMTETKTGFSRVDAE